MARFSKRPEVSRHVERGLPDDAGQDLDDLLYQHKRREEEDEWDRKQEVKKFETVVSQTQYRKMVEHEANIRLLGFRWEDIDHSLVSLKLTDMAEEMLKLIHEDEARIRLENRHNSNSAAVPSLVLRMKEQRADEWAQRAYDIYCDVWRIQGRAKSASFIRAVSAQSLIPMLSARAQAIAHDLVSSSVRTGFPAQIATAMVNGLQLRMRRLQERWRRKLEAEAKECEHAERTPVPRKETPIGGTPEGSPQIPAGGNRQKVHGPRAGPSTGKAGRRPKLGRAFVECAGKLWQKATSDGYNSVPVDKLRQIASALDAADYLPPSLYLEGKYGIELKAFNSRNSNSKLGPIKTWSELISCGDKDHLRGMRRLLSRCAVKLDDRRPLSGN